MSYPSRDHLRARMSPERELISRLLHDLSAYAASRRDTHGRRDERFMAARNLLDRARSRVHRDLGLRWCICCGLFNALDEKHDPCPAND